MKPQADLRVLLLDDEQEELDFFSEIWCRILERVWPRVTIVQSLEMSCDNFVIKQRPHVVIIDNVVKRNGRDIDNIGLEIISKLKNHHPDTLFILFTNNTLQISSLGNRVPNPDIIVCKGTLPNQRYEDEIVRDIKDRIKRLPIGRVALENFESHEKNAVEECELKSLLEQCVSSFLRHNSILAGRGEVAHVSGNIVFDPVEIDFISLRTLVGGYSGASVFLCKLHGSLAAGAHVHFVFKVADKKSITREVAAYEMFVRLHMPHHLRVDLIGVGDVGESSAAFYSFAFGHSDKVSSLTSHIKERDTSHLNKFLDNIEQFAALGWYDCTVDREYSIEKYVNDSEEYSPDKESARIRSINKNVSELLSDLRVDLSDQEIRFDDRVLPIPRSLLRRFRGQRIATCVCHGDLNSNNIIVLEDAESSSVIDFEYTGVDSIYKDYISLEGSVIAHWPSIFDVDETEIILEDIINLESEYIGSGDLTRGKYSDLMDSDEISAISRIRESAYLKFSTQGVNFNFSHHVFLLSLHLFKLLAIEKRMDECAVLKVILTICWLHWRYS